MEERNQASELNWLRWFYGNADFGPADSDVRDMLKRGFMDDTGLQLPEGYELDE